MKIGGYTAPTGSQYGNYAKSGSPPNRLNGAGDQPNGVSRQQPHRQTRAEQVVTRQADEVNISAEARDIEKATQQASTNPVGIEPNPTPKPRSRDAEPISPSELPSSSDEPTEPGSRIDFFA